MIRQRKSFAGTMKEHRAVASTAVRYMRGYQKKFRTQLAHGQCHLALETLLGYERMQSRFSGESRWAKRFKGSPMTRLTGSTKVASSMVNALHKKCIIG